MNSSKITPFKNTSIYNSKKNHSFYVNDLIDVQMHKQPMVQSRFATAEIKFESVSVVKKNLILTPSNINVCRSLKLLFQNLLAVLTSSMTIKTALLTLQFVLLRNFLKYQPWKVKRKLSNFPQKSFVQHRNTPNYF